MFVNESINKEWAKSLSKEDFITHMQDNGTSYSDVDLQAFHNELVPAIPAKTEDKKKTTKE